MLLASRLRPGSRVAWQAAGGGGVSVPDAPAISLGTTGSTTQRLLWSAPNNNGATITGYTIWVKLGGGSYTSYATTSTPNYTVTGLSESSTYYFKITATNSAGTSSYSNEVSATTSVAGARSILQQSDFTYLGKFELPQNDNYVAGFTGRRVSGTFQLLYGIYNSNDGSKYYLGRVDDPGTYTGQKISSMVQTWGSLFNHPADPGYNPAYGYGYDGNAGHIGFTWDEAKGGLWSTVCLDYPQGVITNTALTCIQFRKINSDGTVSNFEGSWALQGIGQRAVYGGFIKVPGWFSSFYSTGSYVTGFGGYASLFDQGNGPSLGPFMVFLNDPQGTYTALASPSLDSTQYNVPSTFFKIAADCRGAVAWYDQTTSGSSAYTGRSSDRGVRASSDVLNYYESGDSTPAHVRQNETPFYGTVNTSGTSVSRVSGSGLISAWWAGYSGVHNGTTYNASTVAPLQVNLNGVNYTVASVIDNNNFTLTTSAGTQTGVTCGSPNDRPQIPPPDTQTWFSPAPGDPDGYGRWTWGDSIHNAAVWLDDDTATAEKHGFLTIVTLNQGVTCYRSSAGTSDGKIYEAQVYDPADMGAGAGGTLAAYKVRPKAIWQLDLPGLDTKTSNTSWNESPPSYAVGGSGFVAGIAYDKVSGKMFVLGLQCNRGEGVDNAGHPWVYVFQGPTYS